MKKRILISTILLLPLILIGWFLTGEPLQNYLSLHNPCDKADILIAEGWLDNTELDFVAQSFYESDYQYLITTGYPLHRDLLMYKNGTYRLIVNKSASETHELNIEVHLRGTLPIEHASVFKFYVNDELIACDSVGKQAKTFSYELIREDSIKSVSVKFINDAIVEGKDRNLYISSICLNGHKYPALDTNATYSINTIDDSTVYYLAGTQALLSRNQLLRKGLPNKSVLAINCQRPGLSKTLNSAKTTIKAIDSIINTKEYCVNIISIPPHTRRTYSAFCKFHAKDSIGIIAAPVSYIKDYQVNRLKNIRELMGILFIIIHPGS